MKLEILGEVPRCAGRSFHQKTLSTEIVTDGVQPILPQHIQMFRMSYRTRMWRGPEGEHWSYDELVEHHKAQGVEFPGISHFKEAVDIEYWEDDGMDGHIEWSYQRTYRMFLAPENEAEERESYWLFETSGNEIMILLQDHVYEDNRDKRQEEYDAKKPTRS